MTSIAPTQCLACSRLDRSTTDPHGTVIPVRCTAYPERIPSEIAMFGEDHRTARGDEQDGLVFSAADDSAGAFDAWRRFAGVAEEPVEAAAGVDTHPGGEQLRHYWLHGEGAAKWSTWTELYHHLVKYLSPDMAKRTAAEWFHERYGIWPGSDANRVKHGKPPRGHVVGPG